MSQVEAVHSGDLCGNPAGRRVTPDGVHFCADFEECRVAVHCRAGLRAELQDAELALDPPHDRTQLVRSYGGNLAIDTSDVLSPVTTVGARSSTNRTTPVARFDDGQGGWIIVASAGGAAQHPAWYHNISAYPDQVRVEVSGKEHRVQVDQLEGKQREEAWARVVERAPRFKGYLSKTDRQLPVLRLTPVP